MAVVVRMAVIPWVGDSWRVDPSGFLLPKKNFSKFLKKVLTFTKDGSILYL